MWPLVFLLCFIQGFGVQGVQWEILIHTSGIQDAGTDSDIFLTLHGSRGSSKEMILDNLGNDFERNQIDKFNVTTDDIGEVCSVTIRSAGNNAAADWHLDKITVWGKTNHIFKCVCWISATSQLSRNLQPDVPCSSQKK